MKWKLTGRFLLSVVIIVVIVLIANIIILIATAVVTRDYPAKITNSPENFTRSFEENISIKEGKPLLSDQGVEKLREANAWIEFLDTNGNVISHTFAPPEAPTHYSPVELVNKYRYSEGKGYTSYVYFKDDISYIINIQDPETFRYVGVWNLKQTFGWISSYTLYIIIADILITIIIAFFFGRSLTKPLSQILNHIQNLRNREFTTIQPRKGLYGEVFHNLSEVSNALAMQEKERAQLEKMREEWISNVSHDMKTPLASIRGYAEIMQDETSTKQELKSYAGIIEKQSMHMNDLLEDLNLTMRLRNQQLPLQLQQTNMVTFLREMVIQLLNEPKYEHTTIHFMPSTENLYSEIDRHFMERAMYNFIYNALLHNDEDVELTIAIAVEQHELYIKIQDNGKGIEEEDLDHIFERYYRGTSTAHTDGTGLGTAIARDIIIAHHGEVWMTSIVNEGTTVHILLPQLIVT